MSKNKKGTILLIAMMIVLLLFCCGGFFAYKFYTHEKKQQEEITNLQGQISLIKNQMKQNNVSWSKETFNYWAIGNSITSHGLADYWCDENRGMAASIDDKDYVHLLTRSLETKKGSITMYTVNYATWETLATDRAETTTIIDNYLSDQLDLITIQLGENASDLSTFESDFEYLIKYIQKAARNAQIIVIGDFWENGDRDSLKEQVAKNCGVTYVSLSKIKDNKDYQVGTGTVVYDDDGNKHTINHEGVAAHPGDKGMAYIANAIEKVVK